jgi:hypothetical protein
MFAQLVFSREFFQELHRVDGEIAARGAAERCGRCGGPVHRGDYERKPRGGLVAEAGEAFTRRFSFCCGREGCRRRTTPPSLRFLSRRAYLGAVVIVGAMVGRLLGRGREVRRVTGVPERTVARWRQWWSGPFRATAVFVAVAGRLIGVTEHEAPGAIVDRLPGSALERIGRLLLLLAPLTTSSLAEGSGCLRGLE